jgi:hypothetical protein
MRLVKFIALFLTALAFTLNSLTYAQQAQAWAVVDSNGNVVAIVMWDGVSQYNPGAGLTMKEVATPDDYVAYNTYIAAQQPINTAANPTQFFVDIANDSVCQPVLSLLAPYQYTMDNYTTNPQAVMLIWSQICANNSSVITPTIQTAVETHAAANKMPLAQ